MQRQTEPRIARLGGLVLVGAIGFATAGCGAKAMVKKPVPMAAKPMMKTAAPSTPAKPPAKPAPKPTMMTKMVPVKKTPPSTPKMPMKMTMAPAMMMMEKTKMPKPEEKKKPGPAIMKAMNMSAMTMESCKDYGLAEGDAWCGNFATTYAFVCINDKLVDVDCTIFDPAAGCAYVQDGGNTVVDCVEPIDEVDPVVLDPAVEAFTALASFPCSQWQSDKKEAYCDGDYILYCKDNQLRQLDCTQGGDYTCGGLVSGNKAIISCVEVLKTKLSPTLDDLGDAFQTEIDCGGDQELTAICDGSAAWYCKGGKVYVLDCANYVDTDGSITGTMGAKASCAEEPANTIDCIF